MKIEKWGCKETLNMEIMGRDLCKWLTAGTWSPIYINPNFINIRIELGTNSCLHSAYCAYKHKLLGIIRAIVKKWDSLMS